MAKKRDNALKKKNKLKEMPEEEYAQFLAGIKNMILEAHSKIAGHRTEIFGSLPEDFEESVPTVEEFEKELEKKERLAKKKTKNKNYFGEI